MPNSETKTYKVSYFLIDDEELRKSFAKELGKCTNHSHSFDADSFFRVLPLTKKKIGKIYFFCLNKYRMGNLPKVGSKQTIKEKDLQLGENEGLIEKAYFAFSEATGEIALQNNTATCYRASFSGIIKGIIQNNTIEITPVLSDRNLRDDDKVVAFDILAASAQLNTEEAIATAKQSNVPFSKEIVGLARRMELASSQKLRITVTAGRDAKTRGKFWYGEMIKKWMPFLEKAKATIREIEDGIDPKLSIVDLIATPKIDDINVQLEGHYPIESDIIKELKRCLSH